MKGKKHRGSFLLGDVEWPWERGRILVGLVTYGMCGQGKAILEGEAGAFWEVINNPYG